MTCTAPACTRPARAAGHCSAHYQRARRLARGEAAPEMAAPVGAELMERIAGPRVTPACASALRGEARRRGEPVYRVAGDVLEEWARRGRE